MPADPEATGSHVCRFVEAVVMVCAFSALRTAAADFEEVPERACRSFQHSSTRDFTIGQEEYVYVQRIRIDCTVYAEVLLYKLKQKK